MSYSLVDKFYYQKIGFISLRLSFTTKQNDATKQIHIGTYEIWENKSWILGPEHLSGGWKLGGGG